MLSATDETLRNHFRGEIAAMQSRIELLETRVNDKEHNGFWKTTLICLFTIINPFIIHWLFSSKRR